MSQCRFIHPHLHGGGGIIIIIFIKNPTWVALEMDTTAKEKVVKQYRDLEIIPADRNKIPI